MFASLRGLAEALQAIVPLLQTLSAAMEARAQDDLGARVDELERTRALWQAEMEAQLQRAESERRAARASEERTRAKLRRAGVDDEGSLEDLPEEYRALLQARDGEGGGSEGVRPLQAHVGTSREARKAHATRMKFGG